MSLNEAIVILAIVLVLVLNLFRHARLLNICLLGEDYARESGLDLAFLRKIIIPSIGIISGLISVYCGPIIFIGLMAPHLTRMIFLTSDHKVLIPGSFLIGSGLCLLVTLLSNGYLLEFSIPVNALLGLMGTPFVLVLLLKTSISSRERFNV